MSGDFEGADIVSNNGSVSVAGGPFLNRDTVKSYEIITEGYQKVEFGLIPLGMLDDMLADDKRQIHQLSIRLVDGKSSLLEIEPLICVNIIKSCFARAPGSCGISLADISSACDPLGRKNCSNCHCGKCTLWPKCCFGRIMARRAKHKRQST